MRSVFPSWRALFSLVERISVVATHHVRTVVPRARSGMLAPMKLIVRWLLLAAALLLVAHLYSGVQVASFTSAMIAAFVLGLLNTLVRPLLVLLTLPVTLLTLGLFLFVINALMFWAAASRARRLQRRGLRRCA